jgi:predicted N-acyltransferase
VGFSLSLQHKDILEVCVCGFDYDAQTNTDFTYFNLAYYGSIGLAIEEGIRRIHFQIASDAVKIERRCKLEKTYSFVKCHNKLLGALAALYIKTRYRS